MANNLTVNSIVVSADGDFEALLKFTQEDGRDKFERVMDRLFAAAELLWPTDAPESEGEEDGDDQA